MKQFKKYIFAVLFFLLIYLNLKILLCLKNRTNNDNSKSTRINYYYDNIISLKYLKFKANDTIVIGFPKSGDYIFLKYFIKILFGCNCYWRCS